MESNSTIILVDAFSQIYRGFYAIPNLRNSQSFPTNAIFAVAKLLFNLDDDYYSDYGAFVFDLGKPAKRLEILPEYKANRPPMPDDLLAQIPIIKKWISAYGWRAFEAEGYEADDIIATFSKYFTDREVGIVSSDKDLAQLICKNVKMIVPAKKDKGFNVWTTSEVIAKFAVSPEQIVDYLSLIGDNSDNIKGIEGVGPKTAAKLLEQFGSIDKIFENIEKISNKNLKEKILQSKEILKRNRELVSLIADFPNESWKTTNILKKNPPNWQELEKIATELDMKTIFKEIEKRKFAPLQQKIEERKTKDNYFTPDLF